MVKNTTLSSSTKFLHVPNFFKECHLIEINSNSPTEARDIDQLQSYAVYARDRVNPQLFNYALSVAILHRPDTKDLTLPLFIETFPGKFIDSRSFGRAREEANVVRQGSRRPIIIPRDYTASDLEPEHRYVCFY